MMKEDEINGAVLRIEKTSIHDGQGLRTVVFLKGCPLRCQWCSTPESQSGQLEKGYDRNRCTGCGICLTACPTGAIRLADGGAKVWMDPAKCRHCFRCVSKCPQRAMKRYGQMMTAAEAVREIAKDEIFYFHSGGGVTLSGGEPLAQADFAAAILRLCRERGIHTAMETSGFAPWSDLEKVLPWLDVLYFDLKGMDPQLHQHWVGADNQLILGNITRADQSAYPVEIVIRIPLIPGVNDGEDNLAATADFCRDLKKLHRLEILPYHRLGLSTYRHLGLDYALKELLPPTNESIIAKADFLSRQLPGRPVRIGGGFSADPAGTGK